MNVDDEIRQIHERYWSAEVEAALQKTALLVEGEGDRDVLEAILEATRGWSWRTRVRIVVAFGFRRVLERKVLFPHPHMLIDRDTRTDPEVDELRAQEPFLHVTHGWCLENAFLDPDFVRAQSPESAVDLEAARERWIRAGAVWWTLQRARERNILWWEALWKSSFGRPRDDFDPITAADFVLHFPVAPAAPVEVERLGHEFEARLQFVRGMPVQRQWQLGVHGKAAFNQLLEPSLTRRKGARVWRVELAKQIGRPAPLDRLFALLGL